MHDVHLRLLPLPHLDRSGEVMPRRLYSLLQGVPEVSSHFVFVIFSGSEAHTQELLIFIQQPWKFAT